MDVIPAMVQVYAYNEMFDHDGVVEKRMAGGAPVNHMIDGGVQFIDKVVPIGLATIRFQPNRHMEFAEAEAEDVGYRIDVLSDTIFDQFVNSVSKRSTPKKSKTLRIKKRI